MKYLITEHKMANLVGNLIHEIYPDFSKGKCDAINGGDEDDPTYHYFNTQTGKLYAKYNLWRRELQLRKELFVFLEDFLGGDNMTFVLDWFNNEFGKDAEDVGILYY